MTSNRAATAMRAYESGRRRRTASGVIESLADASLAAGGVMVANATLSLGFGLPGGRGGISLGASLVCAGLAWITRHRGRVTRPQRDVTLTLRAPQPIALSSRARRAA
jgi:hypothetical protein